MCDLYAFLWYLKWHTFNYTVLTSISHHSILMINAHLLMIWMKFSHSYCMHTHTHTHTHTRTHAHTFTWIRGSDCWVNTILPSESIMLLLELLLDQFCAYYAKNYATSIIQKPWYLYHFHSFMSLQLPLVLLNMVWCKKLTKYMP